jgi:hypothetical protein
VSSDNGIPSTHFIRGDETVRLPLRGDFVDGGKVWVNGVGARPAIGTQGDFAIGLVVDQLGDVAAVDFIGARIDLDDLERLADAATPETADDLEVRALERHHGVFVPVFRRGKFECRPGKRRGVALQHRGQFDKRFASLRIQGAALLQKFTRFPARGSSARKSVIRLAHKANTSDRASAAAKPPW